MRKGLEHFCWQDTELFVAAVCRRIVGFGYRQRRQLDDQNRLAGRPGFWDDMRQASLQATASRAQPALHCQSHISTGLVWLALTAPSGCVVLNFNSEW